MSFNLGDYVDVAERIATFKTAHPEGSLQSDLYEVRDGSGELIAWGCRAWAYRDPDDVRPGIGHAVEIVPGKTPYTRDSEAMNAETSAWGRAIVALGFPTKKIASAEEVQARQVSGAASPPTTGEKTRSASTGGEAGNAHAAPDNPAAKAQAAQAAAKAARAPSDDGAPEHVEITFGKHKGTMVGEAPRTYLEWLVENYQPKTPEQTRIYTAAQLVLGIVPKDIGDLYDDDIPF